jgi:hypothetical protein
MKDEAGKRIDLLRNIKEMENHQKKTICSSNGAKKFPINVLGALF